MESIGSAGIGLTRYVSVESIGSAGLKLAPKATLQSCFVPRACEMFRPPRKFTNALKLSEKTPKEQTTARLSG